MRQKNLYPLLLLTFFTGTLQAQQSFVELRRETSCFDNIRCVNQEFNVSIPVFDAENTTGILSQVNDSVFSIAAEVFDHMTTEITRPPVDWKAAKQGVDLCESGINANETRDLYYAILYNENNITSFILRNDWVVEKQMIFESNYITAEKQMVYGFSVDLATNKYIDVNTLFPPEARAKFISLIKEEYEQNYDEEMSKAGDRLVFAGILFNKVHLIAAYNMMLPNEQSEVRTVEIPLLELYDLMVPAYKEKLSIKANTEVAKPDEK